MDGKPTELAVVVPLRNGYAAALREFERRYFELLHSEAKGNVSFGARAAGLDRNTYRRHAVACGVIDSERKS